MFVVKKCGFGETRCPSQLVERNDFRYHSEMPEIIDDKELRESRKKGMFDVLIELFHMSYRKQYQHQNTIKFS